MGAIICFANNKGGVGKSTSCACVGQAWVKMGKKILFVDLDSQANLTSMVNPLEDGKQRDKTIRDAFLDKEDLVIEHVSENMDLLPSELALSNFDRDTATVTGREYLLADLLKPIRDNYDYILIDCPPALGLITYNALIASDHLIMVTTADGLSYQGMVMIANLYSDVRSNERLNKNLKLTGVIVTRFEKNKLQMGYVEQIKNELRQALIEPLVPKATKIAQAGSFHLNFFEYDPEGKAIQAYSQIAETLAERIKNN